MTMAMNNRLANQSKAHAAFMERLHGLLEDGFHTNVSYTCKEFTMYKLRHHNGNRVTLKLDYRNGELSQFTNNINVFTKKMY